MMCSWFTCCGKSEVAKDTTMDFSGKVQVVHETHIKPSHKEDDQQPEVTEEQQRQEDEKLSKFTGKTRRAGVSAEAVTKEKLAQWKKPVHPKQQAEKDRILQVINTKLGVLFGHLDEVAKMAVVDAMFKKQVPKGQNLIKQGDEGDNFYIVDQGKFDIFVARNNNPPMKVMEAGPGLSFGELSLMYNAKRAATVTATEDCVVWALDRESFQMMLVTAENTKKKTYEGLLEDIDILQGLTKLERAQLSDLLECDIAEKGERIIKQGDSGDKFFIIESGAAEARLSDMNNPNKPEVVVKTYGPGGYFGEIALLSDVPRKASVVATSDCELLYIDKATFDRVLGPIKDVLMKNASKYPKYADFLLETAGR